MANGLYTKGRENILKGSIALGTDNIKAVFVDNDDYTVNLAAHEFLSSIDAGARVATSANLTVTVSGGTVDVADFDVTAVSGDEFESVVFYKDTGDAATSLLIAYYDTATGLAFTPSGSDVSVLINASGLFTWN